jgi:hypothetical protein
MLQGVKGMGRKGFLALNHLVYKGCTFRRGMGEGVIFGGNQGFFLNSPTVVPMSNASPASLS